ncbi:MAG: 4Fe-4S binding protein [Burkholderiaceae bacterium]|nr:4Fe-4S binding protein [Burkholderiaceae bacterium]
MADGVDAGAPAPRRSRRLPAIDPRRCTGCGRCVAACEPQLLSLEVVRWKKSSVLGDAQRCTGCSLCALRCPFDAITMRRPTAAGPADAARPVSG